MRDDLHRLRLLADLFELDGVEAVLHARHHVAVVRPQRRRPDVVVVTVVQRALHVLQQARHERQVPLRAHTCAKRQYGRRQRLPPRTTTACLWCGHLSSVGHS